MRRIIAALLVALMPVVARAEIPPFPEWVLVSDMACYPFEQARLLVMYRDSCNSMAAQLPLQLKAGALLKEQVDTLDASWKKLQAANTLLTNDLVEARKQRDDNVKRAILAEQHAIFGGGLPYLIGGVAVALSVGLIVGIRAAK